MTTPREPRDAADVLSSAAFLTDDSKPDAAAADATEESNDFEDQLDAQLGVLSVAQTQLLNTLSALYQSLAGPQDQLELAGGLNRPQFPVQPLQSGSGNARSKKRVKRMAPGG